MSALRTIAATLTLSAAGLAAIVTHEGYTDRAVVPVAGDPQTVGFGSTLKPDGTPVKTGDTVTPVQAVRMAVAHINKDEPKLAKCVTAPISQKEYDLLVGHAYQYGVHKTCTSELVKKTNAGDYVGACHQYPRWKLAGGKDCSARDSGCYGVYARALERRDQCLAAQAPAAPPQPAAPGEDLEAAADHKPFKWLWGVGVLLAAIAGFFALRWWRKM
jgi:lysozyme